MTPPPVAGSVCTMAAFPVPRYLAETARRDPDVHNWIGGLPMIVAGLADRWSLHVGEPFQPGGQCSWTAPVTGPGGADLVLKVAFRFPGGEERDEAAGLRVWAGNGAVHLIAAHEGESAYALLIERCLPGIPLGQLAARARAGSGGCRAAGPAMGAAAWELPVPLTRSDVRGLGG